MAVDLDRESEEAMLSQEFNAGWHAGALFAGEAEREHIIKWLRRCAKRAEERADDPDGDPLASALAVQSFDQIANFLVEGRDLP